MPAITLSPISPPILPPETVSGVLDTHIVDIWGLKINVETAKVAALFILLIAVLVVTLKVVIGWVVDCFFTASETPPISPSNLEKKT